MKKGYDISSVFRGILCREKGKSFILSAGGKKRFASGGIWDGYIKHWLGKRVCAKLLPQRDYESGSQIVLIWPDIKPSREPFFELYYNERLVKYYASTFGHVAINVNNEIFNFSHLINENEIITAGEYFYRPALGEFAPSPITGRFNTKDKDKPYYDKFGRNFMRTIHVVRVEGADTIRLSRILHNEIDIIRSAPVNPEKPEKYPGFKIFSRSCATIIRDSLREIGFKKIYGTTNFDHLKIHKKLFGWEVVNTKKTDNNHVLLKKYLI